MYPVSKSSASSFMLGLLSDPQSSSMRVLWNLLEMQGGRPSFRNYDAWEMCLHNRSQKYFNATHWLLWLLPHGLVLEAKGWVVFPHVPPLKVHYAQCVKTTSHRDIPEAAASAYEAV